MILHPIWGSWQCLEVFCIVTTGRGRGLLVEFIVQKLEMLLNLSDNAQNTPPLPTIED